MTKREGLTRWLACAASIALALSLVAVSASASPAAKRAKVKVALVTINTQALFFNQVHAGAKAQAKKSNVRLTIFNPNNDPAAQNSAIEDFVQQGVKAIIVLAIDVNGIRPALREAKAKGVRVIAVDAIVKDRSVDAQVGVDNALAGRLIGRYFNAWAKTHIRGKAKIGIVGALNSFIQNIRLQGFKSTVTKAGHRIVQTVDGRNVQENALTAAENLVTAQPSMNAVYTTGEPANIGAIAALKSQGATRRVKLFGWDLTKEAIKAIDAGFEVAVVQQNPYREGVAAVKAAAALAAGRRVQKNISIPVTIVTKTNVDKFRKLFK
jgi:ribose transport system substrate-binding protein